MEKSAPRGDDAGRGRGQHRRMLKRPLLVVPPVVLACTAALAGCGGTSSPATAPLVESNAAAELQQQYLDVVQQVSPQVVQIQTPQGLGSGIVYDGRGDIVTNAHVAGTSRRFLVTLDGGRRHTATLVGSDASNDV